MLRNVILFFDKLAFTPRRSACIVRFIADIQLVGIQFHLKSTAPFLGLWNGFHHFGYGSVGSVGPIIGGERLPHHSFSIFQVKGIPGQSQVLPEACSEIRGK